MIYFSMNTFLRIMLVFVLVGGPGEMVPVWGQRDATVTQPEHLSIHFDKSYYVAGEDIWYAAYVVDQPAKEIQSKILRVELLAPDGTIVQNQKLRIEAGTAQGDFTLAENLESGQYVFRAYTLWNLNFQPPKLYEKIIPVIGLSDPLDQESVVENQSSIPSKQALFSPSGHGLQLSRGTSTYAPREEVKLSVKLNLPTDVPLSGRVSVSVFQGEFERMSEKYTEDIASRHKRVVSTAPTGFSLQFEPEKRFDTGIQLWVETDSGRLPISSNYVVGLVKDYLQADFSYAKEGVTRVQFDEIFDSVTVQVFDANPMEPELKPRIAALEENLPLPGPKKPETPLRWDSTARAYFQHYTRQRSLTSLFGPEAAYRARARSTRIPETPPDDSYRVDDYIVFRDLYTFIKEVVSPVKIQRVKKDTVGLSVLLDASELSGFRSRQIRRFPTMYIVNGYLTSDFDAVANIPWDNIGQIDVYNRLIRLRNLFGPVGVAGVIAFYTRDGSTPASIQYAPNNLRMAGYYTPRQYEFPNYANHDTESSKLPDYRALLYWQSNIAVNSSFSTPFSFYTNDQVGTFWVRVEGITESGEFISAMTAFRVDLPEQR